MPPPQQQQQGQDEESATAEPNQGVAAAAQQQQQPRPPLGAATAAITSAAIATRTAAQQQQQQQQPRPPLGAPPMRAVPLLRRRLSLGAPAAAHPSTVPLGLSLSLGSQSTLRDAATLASGATPAHTYPPHSTPPHSPAAPHPPTPAAATRATAVQYGVAGVPPPMRHTTGSVPDGPWNSTMYAPFPSELERMLLRSQVRLGLEAG